MKEFGFPKELINLTKLCMENVKYQMRMNGIESEAFIVETGLKQSDVLFLLLFNLALEKAVRRSKRNKLRSTSHKSTRVCRRSKHHVRWDDLMMKTKPLGE
ncbi:Hypothetical protein CINCED_3A018693 [Cinara cedri]|uniref:Reverse transcriptase domain n=1 Tax=Cinara cedri TaxID=506608 RepID=A0A5E4MX78_9HEMI|nr:Hypothetical protein CINCED_3A018693 [Cinara cedri]